MPSNTSSPFHHPHPSFPPPQQRRDGDGDGEEEEEEDPRLLAFRAQANHRSVTRNDPSVVEIMQTSVYSVVYHYDEGGESWEKQKMEGPMFVVRRNKDPEYALYMLNRQHVKNVFIPLVPGEMKLTVVDASTLQVARRGEKQKRGIWFSEGSEGVERFRKTIFDICGPPSKKPEGGAQASASPASHSPAPPPPPPPAQDDGLSRLFAGLMGTPGMPSLSPSPTPPPQPMQSQHSRSPEPPIAPASSIAVPLPPSARQPSPLSAAAAAPPRMPSPPVVISPAPPNQHSSQSTATANSVHPPGQTVDDLLNSILGIAPPPPLQPVAPVQPLAQPHPQPEQHWTPGPPQPSQPIVSPTTHRKLGDATFAQAAAVHPPNPPPPHPQSPMNGGTSNYATPAPWPQGPPPPPMMMMNGHGHPMPDHVKYDMGQGLGQMMSGLPMPAGDKEELRGRLVEMLLTDDGFVEHVWRSYLARHGGAGGGGG